MIRRTFSVGKVSNVIKAKLLTDAKERIEKAKVKLSTLLDAFIEELKKYPKKRPKQKYIRTFRFRRSWKKRETVNGFTIMNAARYKNRPYPKYVVGNYQGKYQNKVYHAGRWYLFKDKITELLKRIRKIKT